MNSKKVITGNQAAAYAAILARVQFIAAYPITPQTTIVEYLANLSSGREDIHFERVESEHSAMAACVGASATGVRTFTATSSHGLAFMHEMLHWATGGRYPIVMVNVNRAIGSPWNIHTDQTDSLSQRDTGWLQVYCSSNQEVLDTTIQSFALAEAVYLPVMVCFDGFLLSHTVEPVEIPGQNLVDEFLPKKDPLFKLDTNNPYTIGTFCLPNTYMEMRKEIEKYSLKALAELKKINAKFRKIFGRGYGITESYRTHDAETIIVTNGTTIITARTAANDLRKKGYKIGLVNLRLVRPFPGNELIKAARNTKNLLVIDRSFTSNQGGILAQEIKSALYNAQKRPVIYSCVAGLGGRDIEPEGIKSLIYALKGCKLKEITWLGVKDEKT